MSSVTGHFEKVRALCATAKHVIVGGIRAGKGSQITFYEAGGKWARSIDVPTHIHALCVVSDHLVAGSADGTLRLFSKEGDKEGKVIPTGHKQPGGITAICSAPKDDVYTAGTDGIVRRYDLASGKQLGEWSFSAQPLRAVACDPAFEYVAAAGDDGVVRSIHLASGEKREMPGHQGAVTCLAFTADGRLVSGGEDTTLKIWYLIGAVEFENRGGGEVGHSASVTALVIPRVSFKGQDEGKEVGERIYSVGADGKIKVWRLEDRRKPRTLELGSKALFAVTFAPPPSTGAAKTSSGALIVGGDARTLSRYTLGLDGTTPDSGNPSIVMENGLRLLEQGLVASGKPAREAAIRALSDLAEPEALDALIGRLPNEREAELRTLIVTLFGESKRRAARMALRERLADDHVGVRMAALSAFRKIDGEDSLVPLRAALESRHGDIRREALRALTPLREKSPLVPGLLSGRLTDSEGATRQCALSELIKLYDKNSPEPLRHAYEKGPADIKSEVLIRAAFGGVLTNPHFAPIVARALDEEDSDVRRIGLGVKILERRALASELLSKDEEFEKTVLEIGRRYVRLTRVTQSDKPPTDEEARAAREKIPGTGRPGQKPQESDLEPLLIAMSCRTPVTALRGARGLAKLGDTRALGALLQLSREPAAELRREAASALQALSDTRAKKRLIWMLDDVDAGVRGAALDAYAAMEPDHLVVAESALRSSHEDIRVRGLDRLIKIEGKKKPEKAEGLLADAIEDESLKVRGEAFRTLWAWHEKEPEPVLERTLKARFPDLRQRAVTELETLGDDKAKTKDWARTQLATTIADRDATVGQQALDALVKLLGKKEPAPYLAAMGSTVARVRALGAQGAKQAPAKDVRDALAKLLTDESSEVRIAAVEAIDKLLPNEAGLLYSAVGSGHLDLKVRAAEILAIRRDEQIIEPMRNLLTDKDLLKRIPPVELVPLRHRAATALASLGSPKTLKFFATELLTDKDSDARIREEAARGMANSSRRGDEGYLLDALGHTEIWVRSWAADGLCRLGDARALPVLTGTLRHEHLPIRLAAITSLAALGPEGYGGMLQGLEDPSKEVQEAIFIIVLARDLWAFRKGLSPDLLTSALSSQRPEVRFAAARALELRTSPETYLAHVIDVLHPPRPDKAADMKDWPPEESRGRMLYGLAEALAGETPEGRYAAAQVVARLRSKPLEYFREAQRLAKPRMGDAGVVADNAPRGPSAGDVEKRQRGFLRRLFFGDDKRAGEESAGVVRDVERVHLFRLAFGAYVGLLRQVSAGDDEGHRVRRDSVDRIVELGQGGLGAGIGQGAALPAVLRALDDPNYLVRRAAFSGLKRLFPTGSDEPLTLALSATSADVAQLALDEFAAKGPSARPRIQAALSSPLAEVRRYAFELLERLSEKGSLEPLLAALSSDYADLRIGVIERLATQSDSRVTAALQKAMESDHDDLRLRAAELLAERKDDRSVDVLAGFLRVDDARQEDRARTALAKLGTGAAVRALSERLSELKGAERLRFFSTLAETRNRDAVEVVSAYLDDELEPLRSQAFGVGMTLSGSVFDEESDLTPEQRQKRKQRDFRLALEVLAPATRSKDPAIRKRAAEELAHGYGTEGKNEELLLLLFTDRDKDVRIAAVSSYAQRVLACARKLRGAPKEMPNLSPLRDVVRAGTRELLLPASEALAEAERAKSKGGTPVDTLTLRPLLLLVRAGEDAERPRALLALGSLGDPRALEEIETVYAGGTKEAPVSNEMRVAAIEALGRLSAMLPQKEAERRSKLVEKLEDTLVSENNSELQKAALRGLHYLGGERTRSRFIGVLLDRRTDADVRVEAARLLARLSDPASEAALGTALLDDDSDVREAAHLALYRLFPTDRLRVELLAMKSEHTDVSDPALFFLSKEGDPALLIERLSTLTDEDQRKRLRYGLVRRADLPSAPLVALCGNERAAAREEAASLIGARGQEEGGFAKEARAALGTALAKAEQTAADRWRKAPVSNRNEDEYYDDEDEDPAMKIRPEEQRAWLRALWALSVLGVPEAEGRAREILRGGDQNAPTSVRLAAVSVLLSSKTTGKAEQQALVSGLSDPDPAVRTASAAALGKISKSDALSMVLSVKPFDPVAFSRVLAETGTQAASAHLATSEGRRLLLPTLLPQKDVSALIPLTQSGNEKELRLDAINALGLAGGDAALATLRKIAFDKDKKSGDEALRKAAFRALKRAERKAQRHKKYEAQP